MTLRTDEGGQSSTRGGYLLDGDTTGLWDEEVHKEDGNKLPESKEDVDAPLQGAQHVQEGCTETEHITATHCTQSMHGSC